MTYVINPQKHVRDIVVVGASAGGIPAVKKLLARLPPDLPAIVGIVIHRGAWSRKDWSETLGSTSRLRVVEPNHGDPLSTGVVYIAPADMHMTFALGRVCLDSSSKQHFTRPAIDPLFGSAARVYSTRVVGVVLTGRGRDGSRGVLDIAEAGGLTLAQSPDEAGDMSMPQNALVHDRASAALTLDQLAAVLPSLARGDSFTVSPGYPLQQR